MLNSLSTSHAVLRINALWFALPEATTTGSCRVSVLWAGAESLLFLVMLDEHEREWDGEEEEDTSNNRNSKTCSLKSTRGVETWDGSEFSIIIFNPVSTIHITPSIRCVHNPTASTRTSAVHPSEISKGACESEIKQDGDETEERYATKAADEKESNDGVDGSSARNTFSCAKVVVNR